MLLIVLCLSESYFPVFYLHQCHLILFSYSLDQPVTLLGLSVAIKQPQRYPKQPSDAFSPLSCLSLLSILHAIFSLCVCV